ncbi:hypothetical protein CcaverHIS002_0407520 [Cutaneotrichosporon cavernicola]|uniref:Transmembrane protein n=1 Tax=Cutaneotrichosporon cavernicola TaxID=279322 RepID=A0AA48L4Q3_9TREE|nr:uncharacterized protein CcaverHIS019_0407510 [Cutaneotrichosporon cavernicola]BEI84148.1 hypothetical protein CcaverHIS002_0407520 [Cutaneotrichosporon cavernicola]BEI91931.1 hypothetical protein CcaverHIS019_0407510 [Cutaneotrichosporon cavernicola]BEI99702.1 hypothetical protein CcaverHIS631_0407450 [Cutaneotrichosporon cavernicola]BEJ07477.1 hypothetical protein CcaverHIS641_0407460 [Cutaneotrichosporon cavernicola]
MPSADDIETVRVAIYHGFVTTGCAPTIVEVAASTGLGASTVRGAFAALHASRDIVLSPSSLEAYTSDSAVADTGPGAVVMAHPFASVPLGFSVMGRSVLWWGGCCWDSFALPHLLPEQAPVLVATRCPGCLRPIAMDVDDKKPPSPGDAAIAHFLVPMAHAWDDVVHTCGHQNLFCSEVCLDGWLEREGKSKGYVMSTDTLWHFAKDWYKGRLERGYKRREPAQAKSYFRSVGLRGSFWGLEDE